MSRKYYTDFERIEAVKKWFKKQGSAFESAINYTKKVWDDLLPYLDECYLTMFTFNNVFTTTI